ncbi:DUF6545 domain-containing protein [Microbacterium sp. Gd 4-13]|uniref:DUF6545 domain-containing protein n=1 Tax=Microbacterium sp. Gd 4-13 TaxID=2173179 RepID=UPI00140417F4|nr:DUF6545 domain-containing protein [Microbacterium sp. Gd 4-13]
MVELTVSALMWALVVVLVVFRRARKERSVLYAAVTIAVTMMLNDDDLYVLVDGWFGARDIVHLFSAIILMVGVHFLAQGISRAGAPRYLRGIPALIVLWAAIVVTTVAFFLVPHRGGTSESFMREYGDYPAAAVYSCAQYVYFLVVFSALLLTAVAAIRHSTLTRERVAGALLLVGSLCTMALSVTVIGMSTAQLIGGLPAAEPWRPAYYTLQVGTFLFLTAGLASAPIARWAGQSRRERDVRRYLDRITPLWQEAIEARASLHLETAEVDSTHRLHRRIVEIRDAAMDGRNHFALTVDDRRLLAEAEDRLGAGAM